MTRGEIWKEARRIASGETGLEDAIVELVDRAVQEERTAFLQEIEAALRVTKRADR
jgi:hypothetical protein